MQKADINKLFSTDIGKRIYDTATRTLRECSMDERIGTGVLIGFSGGADSVMLLCVLKRYLEGRDIKLLAVHINHMIRGEEAERDERFSREICEDIGVEFIARHIDVPTLAKESSKGVEEAARNARYSAFADIIRGRSDISAIAVAHNATDNLETVIFNLMRGAGTRGLAGISPVRDNVIRPLIAVPKRDIVNALDEAGIAYVYDSTNSETDYTRNYIRSEILPKLFRLSPSPEHQAYRASVILRSDDDFIESEAKHFLSRYAAEMRIPACELAVLHPALFYRVVLGMAKDSALEYTHVSKIRECLISSGDFSVSIPGGLSFVCRNGECFVGKIAAEVPKNYEKRLSVGINRIEELDAEIILSREPIDISYSKVYKISIQQAIDFDIIKGELLVRSKRDGDSYVYGGMTHKLKKLFNDRAIPPEKRPLVPIICDAEGILWVPGFGVRGGGAKNSESKFYVAIAYKA